MESHEKNQFDGRLKNNKHEKLARNIIRADGDIIEAYGMTYPKASELSAQQRSTLVIKKYPAIIERIKELLNIQGLSVPFFNEKLKDLIESTKENISLDALRIGHRLHGLISSGVNVNIDQRAINIEKTAINDVQASTLVHSLDDIKRMQAELKLSTGGQSGKRMSTQVIDV